MPAVNIAEPQSDPAEGITVLIGNYKRVAIAAAAPPRQGGEDFALASHDAHLMTYRRRSPRMGQPRARRPAPRLGLNIAHNGLNLYSSRDIFQTPGKSCWRCF
jgi:hypothetical protein